MAHWRITRDAGIELPEADRAVLESLVRDEVLATCPRALTQMAERVARSDDDGVRLASDYDAAVRQVREASEAFWHKCGETLGRVQWLRGFVLRVGCKRFGPPTAAHEAAVATETDLTQLRELSDRLLDVATWDELLPDA